MLKEYQIIVARDIAGSFVNNPPIAAGDYQISLDGGPFANLANLPTVIAGSPVIEIMLSETERAASRAVIRGIDQTATKAWADNFTTVTTSIDEASLVGLIRDDLERVGGISEQTRSILNAGISSILNQSTDLGTAIDGIPAALLANPANPIATDASGAVTTSNPSTGGTGSNHTAQDVADLLERTGGPLAEVPKFDDPQTVDGRPFTVNRGT